MENEASYVGEGCCNGWSVWVRGGGLARSKKSTLGTWEGGRLLFNWGGDPTPNLLGGGRFAWFFLVLAARSGARGCLSVGGGGVVAWVKVAWYERGHVICASPVFSGLVAVGAQPSVLLGAAESLAKLGVVEWYEVFRVLSCGGGWCGWSLGLVLSLPGGAGAWGHKGGMGHMGGGRRLEGRDW